MNISLACSSYDTNSPIHRLTADSHTWNPIPFRLKRKREMQWSLRRVHEAWFWNAIPPADGVTESPHNLTVFMLLLLNHQTASCWGHENLFDEWMKPRNTLWKMFFLLLSLPSWASCCLPSSCNSSRDVNCFSVAATVCFVFCGPQVNCRKDGR